MDRITIKQDKEKIQNCFLEKQYFKSYDLSKQLLIQLNSNISITTKDDFFYCYIYLSNNARRLKNISLGIDYAKKALEYAELDSEFIMIYDILAICHRENGEIEDALYIYDCYIDRCDIWLKSFDIHFIRQRNQIKSSKANMIHNKGDMLKDVQLIIKSIELYEEILYSKECDWNAIQYQIDKAYKNIHEIDPSFIHNEATTPI